MIGLWTIVIFLAVLSILVLVHEIGHFITARRLGCKVEEFGIGFPPRLFAWKRKKDGIEYSVNWIPLGGFVRIKGESGLFRSHKDSFSAKPIWKRFVILFAGVAMNFLLAAVLLSFGFLIGIPTALDDVLPEGAKVSDEAVRVSTVLSNTPAEVAGLKMGDQIISINDQIFADAEAARIYIGQQNDQDINFLVLRDEGELLIPMTPEYIEEIGTTGVGTGLITTAFVSFPIHKAVWFGFSTAAQYTVMIAVAIYDILKSLITGQGVGIDLSGPVGIAVMTGEVSRLGLVYLIQFTAILSINLAVINILPLPALDGGRILFLLIEAIRRKPIDERIEAIVHNSGFVLLMGLVILITYRDLVNYSDQILGGIKGIIGL
ncbi:MAG: RIP metalloprotease RseP [Candidatus Uhrbacteria bacterium]